MSCQMSEAEKVYIIHGVQGGTRNDGRGNLDFRPMVLETGLISHTSGSARLRIGSTDILVGVKAEIIAPSPSKPDEGRIQFFVDCSANAAPEFEGRGGDELAQSISSALTSAYSNKISIPDMKKLCLVPKVYCWILYVDIVLLECGGNLYDAASFAVKAALHNTRIPNVNITFNAEKEEQDIELTDDHFDFWRLDISKGAPVLISVCKIGQSQLIDPSAEEEQCRKSSVLLGIASSGTVCLVRQQGKGSLDPDSLNEMIEMGVRVGKEMNRALKKKLSEEENNRGQIRGFLN